LKEILNEAQQRALCHTHGPAMVLAGPGSGKTTVITGRVKRLIEQEKIKPVKSSGTNGKRPASHLENYIRDREFVLALDRYLRDGQGRYIPQEILNISDFTGKM